MSRASGSPEIRTASSSLVARRASSGLCLRRERRESAICDGRPSGLGAARIALEPGRAEVLDNSREAVHLVRAVPREAADARVAVVLDFVNPQRAGWRLRHLRRQARFDEAGGTAHDHGRRIKPRLQPRYWRRQDQARKQCWKMNFQAKQCFTARATGG
jgi:hypothetical protein